MHNLIAQWVDLIFWKLVMFYVRLNKCCYSEKSIWGKLKGKRSLTWKKWLWEFKKNDFKKLRNLGKKKTQIANPICATIIKIQSMLASVFGNVFKKYSKISSYVIM